MINERCFWCDADLRFWKNLEEHGRICPATIKLTDEERSMASVIIGTEFCDHFCCGLPDNVCKARTLVRELKYLGWSKA